MTQYRSESCSSCPYRRDVPSGVWAAHEYDQLVEYDGPTGAQPMATFGCHATPDFFCHGWVAVHQNRGSGFELLALRMSAILTGEAVPFPERDLSLFDSGAEASEHGKREIDNPTPEACEMVNRLVRKYERLRPEAEQSA